MPTLSIIVPVYNVEEYLCECIDSIINQTFRDFELILVNDGSTDNCGMICDSYAQIDSRVRIIHQENKGLSNARNTGIDIAKGQYIAFVDSDDFVDSNMYEIMVRELSERNIDMVVCGVNPFRDNQYKKSNYTVNKEIVLSKDQCFEMILSAGDIITTYAWNKVYKKEIFLNIRYPEGKHYEDIFVITDILSECDSVFVTSLKLYNYRKREGSITSSVYNKRDNDRIISSIKNYNFFLMHYPNYVIHAKAYLYKSYFIVLGKMAIDVDRVDSDDMKSIIRILNNELGFVLKSSEFTLSRKFSAIALRIHPLLFRICVMLQSR